MTVFKLLRLRKCVPNVFKNQNIVLGSGVRSYHNPHLGNDFQYEDVVKSFKWNIPEKFNFSRDVIDKHAKEIGDNTALWYVDPATNESLKMSFKELSLESKKAASALQGIGARNVMCILPKIPEWWVVNIGTIRANITLLPGTTQLQSGDIAGRLYASSADCIMADMETALKVDSIDAALLEKRKLKKIIVGGNKPGWVNWESLVSQASSDHVAVDTGKDEMMQIYFTSGTTGKPKMVAHTHGSYGVCHDVLGKYWLDLNNKDLMWSATDTGWAKSAWSAVFGPWSQGSGVFVHGMPKFTGDKVLDALEKYPVSVFCGAPTLYRMMVQENLRDRNFMALRHCVSAGEPLNQEVIYNWEEGTHLVIKEGYGQTETTLLIGTFKKMSKWVKPGSMGKAAPGYDVRIVNNIGKEVPNGEQGNIAVKIKPDMPPGLFKGYCENAAATQNSFCGDYYLTGDRGVQDEDGYFWFFARQDDLIISSGYRIGPFEVESALIKHEAVAESAAVASPDKDRGQVVKAFVVLADSYKDFRGVESKEKILREQLQQHVKDTTAPYKYPRKIEFVDQLPKTVSLKIKRGELRNKELKA